MSPVRNCATVLGAPAIAGSARVVLVANALSLSRISRRLLSTSVSSSLTKKVFWGPKVVFGGDQFQHTIDRGTIVVDRRGDIVACFPGETREEAFTRAKTATLSDAGDPAPNCHEFIDLSSLLQPHSSTTTFSSCLSPGLIDVHTHISALGRNWEGYTTATQAAAAGGVTTIIGMPLNSLPPTCSVAQVEAELAEAHQRSKLFVDVGLWGGVIPGTVALTDQLCSLLSHPNILGLKAFLSPLPAAAGYQAISPTQLLEVAKLCGTFDKPILVHSELMTAQQASEAAQQAYDSGDPSLSLDESWTAHVQSRPVKWEQDAVRVVVEATQYCDMHIVHLSDGLGCLPIIDQAKHEIRESTDSFHHEQVSSQKAGRRRHRRLTVETCPHYLLLDTSQMRDGDTTVKCFPPIRGPEQRRELWLGLSTGLIDMIASDHSPCEPSMRKATMRNAWGGLSGLQYQLPATWTSAHRANGESSSIRPDETKIAKWWSSNPAKMAGLDDRGSIEPGKRADFVWWDTDFVGIPDSYMREYHRWRGDCFYSSQELRGRVLGTWLTGTQIYDGMKDEFGADLGSYICR